MQLTKRRLTDLWVVGRELSLDDGSGEPIKIWIQKLNPVEAGETTRRCDAVRAKLLAARHERSGVTYQAVQAVVMDIGNDVARIADILLAEDRVRLVNSTEARMANEEEWSKNNYLQGLRDAWTDGVERRWLEDKTDPEADRVFTEINRFTEAVGELVDAEMDVMREAMMTRPLLELQDDLVQRLLELDSNQAWVEELRRCEIYYGTRETGDHRRRCFADRDEVDDLSPTTYQRLRAAFENLEVDVLEGKGSPAPTPSFPSSGQPGEEAAESSSGLVGATA
jgi:hypothetical protein